MPTKKKRTTVARKAAALSAEDRAKREMVDLLKKDLALQTEQLIKDKEREIEKVSTEITTMYKVRFIEIFCLFFACSFDAFLNWV